MCPAGFQLSRCCCLCLCLQGVPVTDPAARAEPVPPAEWKRMLEEVGVDALAVALALSS